MDGPHNRFIKAITYRKREMDQSNFTLTKIGVFTG